MGFCVKQLVFLMCYVCILIRSEAIHTSGKLDFGDSSQVASLVKNEKRVPVKIFKSLDTVSSPTEVTSTVSCGATGCNATNNNNSSVETEVVVHVQTKVNFDKSQEKKVLDDTSDVPVVVGYRGSTPDITPDEEQFRGTTPDILDRSYGSSVSHYDPHRSFNTYSPIRPSYNQINGQAPYQNPSAYRPPNSGYYGSSTPNSYGYYEPTRPPNYFGPSTARPQDIYPSLAITTSELNRRGYDHNTNNGVELQIPHFDHTYNRHYFSEEPPPHTVSFGKSNSFNPVEFKSIPRNKWRPSFWNGRNHKYAFSDGGSGFVNPYMRNPPVPLYNHPVGYRNHGTECLCKEQRNDRSDSVSSYAASSVNHHIARPIKDPGTFIDDKLAPLN